MRADRILLVDDDKEVLDAITSVLEIEGYLMTTASDGDTAIELLNTNEFDLVISDLEMPKTDGIAVLNRARQLRPEMPIMILTGNCERALAIETLDLCADVVIFKPCSPIELGARVAKYLEVSRTNRLLDRMSFIRVGFVCDQGD